MLFSSLTFLIFAILFYSLWPFFRRSPVWRWGYLTVASCIFYGWWDWRFLFLILFSGLLDFVAGLGMERFPQYRKAFLGLSLVGNLGSLAVFKYSAWLAGLLEEAAGWMGMRLELTDHLPAWSLILPVGISFYTFQSLSYTLDIYRGRLKPVRSFLHFMAYLSLFPQLVAGPIIRARDLLDQLAVYRPPSRIRLWHGLRLVVTGLFQKMVLADNLAVMVNHGFTDPTHNPSTLYWWAVMMAFSFQIYFDFAGYSQIARGLAKWMGLHFKMNFNHPYLASSFADFWTCWHISLSQWFRDYVYIPLGGNRRGHWRMWRNLWITLLISGLWHGAATTFLVWGAVHALLLTVEKLSRPVWRSWPAGLRRLGVWVGVLTAWVFFRADSMGQAMEVLRNLYTWSAVDLQPMAFFDSYFYLGLAILFEGLYGLSLQWGRLGSLLRHPVVTSLETGVLVACCLFLRGPEQAFIYFQF